MNTTFFVPLFLGTFSGFLATFPIGPSKILAVRRFLLLSKGNESELSIVRPSNAILLASISGLIFAQILLFLSLQFPFLYSLWVKPHFFSLFFLSLLFIYFYKLKNLQFDIYASQTFLKSESTISEQQTAFLETLLLQLLNPIVLPNPVFPRLTNLFLFRYSTTSTFLVGNLLGLLSGYGTFYLGTLFLLKRLELDSPTIFRLVKIKIHQFFVVVFFVFSFICLSRTPLPSLELLRLKKPSSEFSIQKSWFEEFWPDCFFGYEKWKRPLRFVDYDTTKKFEQNDSFKPFNKMFFSQFFFEGALKDGKYSLYHNFPKSFSVISKNIDFLLETVSTNSETESFRENENRRLVDEWIQEKKNRQKQITDSINLKINHLQKGIFLGELVEKKFSSFDNNRKKKLSKETDPRLSIDIRGKKLFLKDKSFLFLTQEYISKKDPLFFIEKNNFLNLNGKNKLKLFFSKNSKSLENCSFLEWKPLKEFSLDENQNFQEKSFENLDVFENKINLKNTKNWEQFFQKIPIYFQNLLGPTMGGRALRGNFSNNDLLQEENTEWLQEQTNSTMSTIFKPFPSWSPELTKNKIKNLKRITKRNRFLINFFPKREHLEDIQNFVSPSMRFFRRQEFPETIKARRCKALCWNIFQKRPHSPFFLNNLNLLKNFFALNKKKQSKENARVREWRSNSKNLQFLRDSLLSLQAYIRKYIKFPLLIIIKNGVRKLFLQPTEWEKDFTELSQEVYIDCDFYGNPVSIGVKFPNLFEFDQPKQIKIVKPFQLRFWTRSQFEKQYIDDSDNYSFLNAWGKETKIPFGEVKKSPLFWKFVLERCKLLLQYKIIKRFSLSPKDKQNSKLENALKISNFKSIATNEEKLNKKVPNSENEKINKINLLPGSSEKDLRRMGDILDKNLKDKKPKRNLINNSNYVQTQNISSSEKKQTRDHRRKYTFRSASILLEKQWFYFSRNFLRTGKKILFGLQMKVFQFKKFLSLQNKKIFKISQKILFGFSRLISLLYSRLEEFFSFFLLNFRKVQKENSFRSEELDLYASQNLSQAHIFHTVWEDRIMSRPHLTSLMRAWNQTKPLKENLEEFLNREGIVANEKPEHLTEYQWREWLKDFGAYTPSFKVWKSIFPKYWTKAVEQYWKQLPSSKLENVLNEESNKFQKHIYLNKQEKNTNGSTFLDAHWPLFQAAQKEKKLWKLNTLTRNFTEIKTDENVDSYSVWDPKNFDKKTYYLFDNIKRGKAKKENLVLNSSIFSSLPKIKEKKIIKNIPQLRILKKLPLIDREKQRIEESIKLETVQQRESFFPISRRRWKFKKVKNKLAKLAKTVMLKPQRGELSSSFSIGIENQKLLNDLFQSENKLFQIILENWNSKVLDDELLMYNTVSSLLRFVQNSTNRSLFADQESFSFLSERKFPSFAPYFVLLEEVYLPSHLREIRILDLFNLENDNSKIENVPRQEGKLSSFEMQKKWSWILQQNENAIKDRQIIVRFLWPTHRLEDLGCINRFWMGVANQSRFSTLRIHTFPKV